MTDATAVAGTVVNLGTDQSLTNGTSYLLQNSGSSFVWFGAYATEPSADDLRASGHPLGPGSTTIGTAGQSGGFDYDASVPVYVVAFDRAVSQVTVSEA